MINNRSETFKALGPCSGFLLFISIAKDLLWLKAKTTPKTHLTVAPEATLPGGERVGRNFFAFRLPPYKSASHRTVLKKDSPVTLHGWKEFLMWPFMCLLWSRKESEKERSELVVSLTWNIHEAVHVHPPALPPLLSSALWRLPGNLIVRGKILHSHISFAGFYTTAGEGGQIRY